MVRLRFFRRVFLCRSYSFAELGRIMRIQLAQKVYNTPQDSGDQTSNCLY